MKQLMMICSLFFSTCLFGQNKGTSSNFHFSKIDKIAGKVNAETPFELATRLTTPFNSELEKVRSIFSWITTNISYNVRRFSSTPKKNVLVHEVDNDTSALPPLNERVSINILKTREAVCDGYARLFKNLCDHAGLRAEIIHGYAKPNGRPAKFISNHAWNAVQIENKWYLLDVTWAAGFLNFNTNEFVNSINEKYFMADPKEFISTHYPEDLRWTLLTEQPQLKEFQKNPFQYSATIRRQVISYYPAQGTIEAVIGDTIWVEIESNELPKHLYVTDSLFIDTATIGNKNWQAILKNKGMINENRIKYFFAVENEKIEWLNVIFNDEVILRYQVFVKPAKEMLTASN